MNRIFIFLTIFVIFSILETFFQENPRTFSRKQRWPGNFAMAFSANLILRVIFPVGLAGYSHYLENNNFGLFNNFSIPAEFILSIVLLDFWIWFQHVLTHKFQPLWKLHRVHHSDVELDASSALRFHPIEIIFSILFKIILITLLGIKEDAILWFEAILNGMAIFNHANLYLPSSIERLLRKIVVTPQMHLIHHNQERKYSDTNYGFNLSLWDRLFKTYTDQKPADQVTGQKKFRSLEAQSLLALLKQPFAK